MKVISQETFDQVILENIKEFDNTLEEAVDEAVKEFEAQGVNLGNVVTNVRLSDNQEGIIHEVLESLNSLKQEANFLSTEEILFALSKICDQCKLSLAHRVLATKHDGYNILLSLVKKVKTKSEILAPALDALTSLSATNPDILNEDGINIILELFNSCNLYLFPNVIESLAKWCFECCLKHENNRQDLMQAGVPSCLVDALRSNKSHGKTAKALCKSLRAFTLDDDIRTEFGKAHEHARILVEDHGLIELCLELVQESFKDSELTNECLSTLSCLCVRAEYCQEAVDKGALAVLNDIFVSFPDSAVLNRQCLNLLKTISGNDKVKEDVMRIGGGELIVRALITHQNWPGICEAGCAAVSMLALRVPIHAKQLIQLGAAEAVVQAMKMHPSSKQIQKLGCMAVRNLVARVPENRVPLIECQVEDVIHAALKSFEDDATFKDVAKAALRDLDLKVNLEEQWKGTGVEIER